MSKSRVDPIIASFASVIKPGSRIIDIGAGKGHLAREMVEQFEARVTLVDVAHYNQTNLPLIICDSRALAFEDDSFDYAILSFVLHHSPNPKAILSEALRVARRAIVIENDVRGKIRGALTRAIDSLPALRYGTPPCHIVQSREEWLKMFREFQVEARVLKEFTLEFGFFRCFTTHLQNAHDGLSIRTKRMSE